MVGPLGPTVGRWICSRALEHNELPRSKRWCQRRCPRSIRSRDLDANQADAPLPRECGRDCGRPAALRGQRRPLPRLRSRNTTRDYDRPFRAVTRLPAKGSHDAPHGRALSKCRPDPAIRCRASPLRRPSQRVGEPRTRPALADPVEHLRVLGGFFCRPGVKFLTMSRVEFAPANRLTPSGVRAQP